MAVQETDVQEKKEKTYYTEKSSWNGKRYFIFKERTMTVPFSELFGKEAEESEDFITSCVSKKAYHKMMRLFAHTNNVILNQNKKATEKFLYRYYCVKFSLDTAQMDLLDPMYFVTSIVNLFDTDITNEIRKFVKQSYKDTGDVRYKENKNTYVPEITFLDYHIKILFCISCMTHFVIPLCLEYLRFNREINANTLLVNTFTALFPIAEEVSPELISLDPNETKSDVHQKLYSFVKNRVETTLKSDEAMWNRLSFLGVNPKSTIEDIVNKLITNILPEYDFDGNIMHLNISVIRKSIQDYTLRKKDPFSINCFVDIDSSSQVDDNSIVTEADQFDSYNAKRDALSLVIRHVFTEDTVNKIFYRKQITFREDLYNYYLENLKPADLVQQFQQFVIFSSFHTYFGGTENMYSIPYKLYIKLIVGMIDMLEKLGIPELVKYVTAIRNKHYIIKKETKFSRNTLAANAMYTSIIQTKYRSIQNMIDRRNNFIEAKINYLINNEFIYNTPDQNLNGKIIPRNDDEIYQGVLKFFQRCII